MNFDSPLTRLAEPLLTRDPAQRLRLIMCLNAAFTYFVYSSILGVQVWLGLAPRGPTLALIAAEIVVALGFYAAVRSGLNLRLRSDPSLTIPQLVIGFIFTMVCYGLVGPVAPAVLLVISSQIVYMVFAMPPRTVMRMATGSLVGLALTMVVCHQIDPLRYPVAAQALTFAYACLVIPIIAKMAHRVTSMNERLRANKRELQAALAQVRDLATRDGLTNLYNRRHLTELLTQECAQHRRSVQPLSVALLDIDLFKGINDRHGHKAGDAVLCRFATVAREVLRESDLLGRWGGEEFLVVFPDTGTPEALRALERLRTRLANENLSDIAPGLQISFSGGLTLIDANDTIDCAVERADQAMYRAKTAGRNRCLIADTPASDSGPAAAQATAETCLHA